MGAGLCNAKSDFANYFSLPSMGELALGVGVAAPLANTKLDNDFRNWYQTRVETPASTRIAYDVKNLGNGLITIPVCGVIGAAGQDFDEYPMMATLGEFGDRSMRAYLVGTAPMLAMQELLGSGRPSDTADHSYWHPFAASDGVSGHAYIGAVPFITAAKMSDDYFEKGFFYACSTLTAWSRIDTDSHYLSQACWAGGWPTWPVRPSTAPSRSISTL